jgi:hypothetical protein
MAHEEQKGLLQGRLFWPERPALARRPNRVSHDRAPLADRLF